VTSFRRPELGCSILTPTFWCLPGRQADRQGETTAQSGAVGDFRHCLVEVVKLTQLGRIEMDLDDPRSENSSATHVWPITLDICRAITQLDFRVIPPTN
jgi:hypothetical protein